MKTIRFSILSLLLFLTLSAVAFAAEEPEHHDVLLYTEPAGCESEGANVFVCTDCGRQRTEILKPLGHDFGDQWVVDREPTCAEEGVKSRHCSRCDARTDFLKLRALPHEFEVTVVEPTCTSSGYTHHVCTRCGAVRDDQIVPASGHKPAPWIVDKEASCESEGRRHQVCSVCGETLEVRAIPATGHAYSHTVVPPTCTEKGYTEHTCGVCGKTYRDKTVAAKGHVFAEAGTLILTPTCTEPGSERVTCGVCGERTERTVPALGHDYGDNWVVDRAPTCRAKGEKSLHCRRCDARKSVTALERTAHTPATDVIEAPTCTKSGRAAGVHCAICGVVLEEAKVLPPTGHRYAVTDVLTKATCTEKGKEAVRCTVCGATDTRTTAALGHDFSDWTVDKAATCTAKGEKSQHCARCGKRTNITELPRTDHTVVKDRAVKPTCTKTGLSAGSHCSVCKKVLKVQKVLPASGHTGKVKRTQAGWKKNGLEKEVCAVCGKTLRKEKIPAVQSIRLSAKTFVFDNDVKKPTVVIKTAEGKKLKPKTDYKLAYDAGRKKIGVYHVTVTFRGRYTGSRVLTFRIVPKAPTGLLFTASTKSIALTWNAVRQADGYRIYEYNEATGRSVRIGTATSPFFKIKRLAAGEKPTYFVRAFKRRGDAVLWSAASAKKLTATKPTVPELSVRRNGQSAVLSWNNCGDCDYAVYAAPRANGPFVCIGVTRKTSFVAANQPHGQARCFKVKAAVKSDSSVLASASSEVRRIVL